MRPMLAMVCAVGSILLCSALADAQTFTYQGMLKQAGVPANGNYDFQFSLWTAASGGSQVGSTLTRSGVNVAWGVFSVELDFGNVWDGSDRYLQIAVRPAGSGSYTTLSPRVKVNRAPYSQFAFSAPWSGIVGMPAGFADGVDNDTTYSAGAGLQLVGTTFSVATGGIVTGMLANGAVTTDKIADGAVTSAKLADGAVTTAKIADGAVTSAKLSATGVSAGTYGSATQVGRFTVDAQGRITSATNVTISGVSPGGSAGGDLSGTYPNPTVARLQGRAVSSSAPGAGQVLKWDGSAWSPANDESGSSLWQQAGSNIFYNAGNVGIGTNSPAHRLHVETSTGDRAIYGLHTATSGFTYGVVGQSNSSNGTGMFGWATDTTSFTTGVAGRSDAPLGRGVYGWATATGGANAGVFGETHSISGTGVRGVAAATSGFNYGVYGESQSASGIGVYGRSNAGSGLAFGVCGHTTSPDGFGGYFIGHGYFSGKLGVGTTTPTARLQIDADSSLASATLRLHEIETEFARLEFTNLNSTRKWHIAGLIGSTQEADRLNFWNSAAGDVLSLSGSGNVGIGTTAPATRLHVQTNTGGVAIYAVHTGTSGDVYGVRGQSDSTSGIGVFGWATATGGYAYGVTGQSASNGGTGVLGYATATSGTTYGVHGLAWSTSGYGVYSSGRFAATGTKSFQIDHPLSPETHFLNHFCAEGPEPYNLYRGTVVLDARGEAWVQLPDYFEAINRDPSYHLTPIGAPMPNLHVAVEIQNNRFKIAGGVPGKKVSWEVKAVRNDRWVQEYGYQSEQVKPRQYQGKYLHPELYGQPKELGIHYHPEPAQETPVKQ